jgi:acetyl-CoA carboxylase carboxyltransferase component
MPQLTKEQSDQMKTQLVSFWKRAEQGTEEKKSKFMQVRRYDLRMANIYAANDLFLCGFAASYSDLEGKNNKIKADVQAEKLVGAGMVAWCRDVNGCNVQVFCSICACCSRLDFIQN